MSNDNKMIEEILEKAGLYVENNIIKIKKNYENDEPALYEYFQGKPE